MNFTNKYTITQLLAATFFSFAGSLATAQETLALNLGDVTSPVGSVIAMPVIAMPSGAGVSSLVLNLDYNPAQLSIAAINLENSLESAGKTFQHRTTNGTLALSIFGGVDPISTGQIATIYWKLNPTVSSGATININNAESSAASPAADAVTVQYTGGAINVTTLAGHHSADYEQDWTLQLSELLRVIQFFNSTAMHCDASTEDGYKPGNGDTACTNHNSDYNLPDWKINLSELLRAIQIYNAIGSAYHPDGSGEDGFMPGPFGE